MSETLDTADHKDYLIAILPKHNHAFQTCRTGSISEIEKIKVTTSPLTLNIISHWIVQQTLTD